MRLDVFDVLGGFGAALVLAGLLAMSVPLAAVVAGVALMARSYLGMRQRRWAS